MVFGLFRNLNFQKGDNVASHLEGDFVVHRIHIANNLLGPTLPLALSKSPEDISQSSSRNLPKRQNSWKYPLQPYHQPCT